MGKGAVLELRLQLCIYKQCTHKLLRDIFKKVLVSDFTPSIDDARGKRPSPPRFPRVPHPPARGAVAPYASSISSAVAPLTRARMRARDDVLRCSG